MTTYLVTLRDRETQTVVGYYNGAWTTDRRRALTVRRREAAEAHAARMRDCCPRNADVIKVEIAAADQHLPPVLRPRTREERDPRRASRSRSQRDRQSTPNEGEATNTRHSSWTQLWTQTRREPKGYEGTKARPRPHNSRR